MSDNADPSMPINIWSQDQTCGKTWFEDTNRRYDHCAKQYTNTQQLIERLEAEKKPMECNCGGRCNTDYPIEQFNSGIQRAINIVRGK